MLTIPTTHFDKRGSSHYLFDLKMVSTRSSKGVLRGMYLQPGQERSVTVALGEIYHVMVDLETRTWVAHTLSEKRHEVLHIPDHFAHGYCVLSETAIVISQMSVEDCPEKQQTFRFDDRDIAIDWPIEYPLLALCDEKAGSFAQVLDHRERGKACHRSSPLL